ncbi:MAG: alginate export family protein [Erythrobacter sp.]|uniref:alginate export family protein n=1 Tax=Erythrobacter sp. TaxID=1042 RepID=UPI0032ED9738
MVLVDDETVTVRGHLQGGINAVAETNLFWNLSDTFAPQEGFDPDTQWLELYVKPGVSFEARTAEASAVYGKVSGVGSHTQGTDAFDFTDEGAVTLEEAYLGYRTLLSNGVGIDVSAGARELKLGTGMLIANGGASGFELGALKFGPRKAWDLAGIARITKGRTTFTGFYLSPNERPVIENDNRLAGADLRHDFENRAFLGTTFVKVTRSQTPWVQAAPGGIGPPTVIPGGRDDTNTIGLYGRTGNMDGALRNWLFALDLAYQWNDRLDQSAWAGRVQVGYTFSDAKWRPSITYSYQTFSGDDPDTPELERYDPLFYEGSPSAWATGSKSSMVFINSNVRSHGVAGRIQPSPKDTITLRYNHIRANELRSPLQFGQASRVDLTPGGDPANIVAGVTDAHVSDDLFIEYSRIISRNLFLTAGLSVSDPGEGIENVVPGGVPEWTGGFVNLVFNF